MTTGAVVKHKRQVAVIDAETDPFRKGRVPMPFLWGYYDGQRYLEFSDTAALVDFVSGEDQIVYAHNGGKFDFHYLLPWLEKYDDVTIINGRLAKVNLGLAELRDSVCILPVALSAYKKDDIDYGLFEPGVRDKPANRAKISKYLHDDCQYLYEMVSAYRARFGDSLTLAGSAMAEWGRISKSAAIAPAEQTDKEFYDAFAPYYYGGRVECFESGVIDTDFSVYDINSAYPYAMRYHDHPYGADYEVIDGYAADADFYRLRCVSAGALPYRGLGGEDGKSFGLRFPRDDTRREYTITRWELDAAKATRTIRQCEVLESLRFSRRVNFAPYIDQFWREREAAKASGDVLGGLFAKLIMNSLYGKWAANPDNYREYRIHTREDGALLCDPKSDYEYNFAGELGPWLLGDKPLPAHKMRYYNVATGASITGYVRAMLWRAIHSSEGVIYCDTDSIAVRRAGAAVSLGERLGQWKHEGDFDRAGIAGKKLYIFRGKSDGAGHRSYKTASKGVRLTAAELWRVARGGEVEYESETPTFSAHKAVSFVNRTIRGTA